MNAPNEDAVRNLHAKAHGLMPHNIIEVDPTLVESTTLAGCNGSHAGYLNDRQIGDHVDNL